MGVNHHETASNHRSGLAAQLQAEAGTARLRSGAEAPRTSINDAGDTPADILSRRAAARTWQPSRRANFGARASAVQLSLRDVRRTNHSFRGRTLSMKLSVLVRSVFDCILFVGTRAAGRHCR